MMRNIKGITPKKKKRLASPSLKTARLIASKEKMRCGDFYLFIYSFKGKPFSWLESFRAGISFPYSLLKGYEEI